MFTPTSNFISCDLIFKLIVSQDTIYMGFNNFNSISYLFTIRRVIPFCVSEYQPFLRNNKNINKSSSKVTQRQQLNYASVVS